jgi:hypothetical protein|nr:hypothetical protein MEP432_gp14 [Methylophilales phage MEP432]
MAKKYTLPNIPDIADFYMVWWLDINSDSSWLSPEKAKTSKPTICLSMGWLISTSNNCHRIAGDYNFNDDGSLGDIGNVTTIPTRNIIKLKRIKIK